MMGTTVTYYDLLGLPANTDADAIHAAYRQRAKHLHPDAGGDAEAFKELQEAYRALKDPVRRRLYDVALNARGREAVAQVAPAATRLEMWMNIAAAVAFAALAALQLMSAALLQTIGGTPPAAFIPYLQAAFVFTAVLSWRIFVDRRRPFRNPLLSLWDGAVTLVWAYIGLVIYLVQALIGITIIAAIVNAGVRLWSHLHG